MKPELIVALDVPNEHELRTALQRLPTEIAWFKVGLELFCSEGPDVLNSLKESRKRIFLDLKLHDIPRTVEKAVSAVCAHDVELLTIHASGGATMMKAAVAAAHNSKHAKKLRILAVTVLTSLDQADLISAGIQRAPDDQALALAEMAYSCGVDGVVCSIHEAARIRQKLGPEALIVTPGIRLPGGDVADQKRTGTPRDAVKSGSSHLVVGRPILEAQDPGTVYRIIMEDMQRS
jgi:orotidine-5'-phosphate decarboxylase